MNKRNYFDLNDAGKGSALFIILQNLFILVLTGAIYAGFYYGQIGGLLITALLESMFVLTVFVIASTSGVHFARATLLNKKPNVKQVVLAIILAFVCLYGFSGVTNVFYYFLRTLGYEGTNADLAVTTAGGLIIEIICVCIVPAFCEEMLFRGLILNGLRKLGKWPAILLSAGLFMLMHGNPDQTIFQFVLGIVLGLAFYNTGSIWVPMIIHFTNNFYVTVISFITNTMDTSGAESSEITSSDLVPILLSAVAIAVVAAFLIYIICNFMKKKADAKPPVENANVNTEATKVVPEETAVESPAPVGDVATIPLSQPIIEVRPKKSYGFAIACLVVSGIWLIVDWVLAFIKGIGA